MLGTTADIVTLLAFAVTIFTAVKVLFINRDVQKLSNRYLLKLRLPEQLAELEDLSFELGKYFLVTEGNCDQVRNIIAKISAISHNVVKRIRGLDIQLPGCHEVVQRCRMIHTQRHNPGSIRISPDTQGTFRR